MYARPPGSRINARGLFASQITADNFDDLEVAWRWRTADTHLTVEGPDGASVVAATTLFDLLEAMPTQSVIAITRARTVRERSKADAHEDRDHDALFLIQQCKQQVSVVDYGIATNLGD